MFAPQYGLTTVAINEDPVDSYDGLSGPSVLENELVGIHARTFPCPSSTLGKPETTSAD